MSDQRRRLAGASFDSPWNGPLENDKDAHVAESAKEEDLLWQPLEEEIYVIFEMKGVQGFEEDG